MFGVNAFGAPYFGQATGEVVEVTLTDNTVFVHVGAVDRIVRVRATGRLASVDNFGRVVEVEDREDEL